MRLALLGLLLIITAPVEAAPAYCRLLPHSAGCRATPAPAPMPVPRPSLPELTPEPVPVTPPEPEAQSPPVVQPTLPTVTPEAAPPRTVPSVKAKSPRTRPVKPERIKPKFKRKRVAMPDWWDCAEARQKAAGKTPSQLAVLEALGRALGFTLTEAQKEEAKRCVGFS